MAFKKQDISGNFFICRVLIGSPLVGQPEKRTGDVYKCPVGRDSQSPCTKLNLPGMKENKAVSHGGITEARS